jgi:hypothetical protein
MTKYNAVPTTIDGKRFASKREAARYSELRILEQAGEICDLQCQPRYEILPAKVKDGKKQRATFYVADFQYYDLRTGDTTVEDVKGVETAVFKLKRKLFENLYPEYKFMVVR